MLEEKIVELTEAIKELTLWVKSNDSTPVEKPVEKEPKTRKRRTKKEIESEKKLTEIVAEDSKIDLPVEEETQTKAPVEVTYDMVKNAAKALVNIGPGGPGLAKAAAIRDGYGYIQLADIEPKDYHAIYKDLSEAVKTWVR